MLGLGGCDFLHIFSVGLIQSSGNSVDKCWLVYTHGFVLFSELFTAWQSYCHTESSIHSWVLL